MSAGTTADSTSALTGRAPTMGTKPAESWDDFFDFQLASSSHAPRPLETPLAILKNEDRDDAELGPSPSTRTPRQPEVENWDDDFADEDEDEFPNGDEHGADVDPEEQEDELVQAALLTVATGALVVSPRSVRSQRAVVDTGPEDLGEEDSDEESWDEDEDDEGESWDEEENHERVPPPACMSALAVVDTSLSPASSSVPGDGPLFQLHPPLAPLSSHSSEPSHRPLPQLPPSELLVQSPSAFISPVPAPGPSPLSTSPTVSLSTVPSTTTASPTQAEFGLKAGHDDHEEEVEDEDEDATITARSRHGHPGARHARGHARGHSGSARPLPVPPPVPPVPLLVPAVPSASAFTPPPVSSAIKATPANEAPPFAPPPPAAFPSVVDVDDDRGEGPSRRLPVFSPPGSGSVPTSASVSASTATSTPTTTSPLTPAAASQPQPQHRDRKDAVRRPRTADGLGPHSRSQGGQGTLPVRTSLDAYQSAGERDGGRLQRPDAYAGSATSHRPADKGERGFLSRLGQGVSRWASTSNSNSSSNSNLSNADKRRGRGRSATVTGATSTPPPPPPTLPVSAPRSSGSAAGVAENSRPRASAQRRTSFGHLRLGVSSSRRPLVSVPASAPEAIPRSSLSSARPSTSSARPSTSSARPSTSSSSSSRPSPRPASRTAAPAAQRNSIASLLSIYTHRSRASSISGSRRTSVLGSDTADAAGQEEAAPRTSISSWTQRLFSGSGNDANARQSSEETRPRMARRGSMSGQDERPSSHSRQRQSLDIRPRPRRGVVEAAAESTAAAAGAGGDETKGVLGFFGRRRRSNTVTAVPSSSAAKTDGEEVYADKKVSRSQRSLLLLGRKTSMLVRRASQKGAGRQVAKDKEREIATEEVEREEEKPVEAKSSAPQVVFSPPSLALAPGEPAEKRPLPGHVPEPAAQLVARGMKRRIPSGRASLPLALPTRSESEPLIGTRTDTDRGMDAHQNEPPRPSHKHTHSYSQSTSRSTSHSTSNSLSSIGELRIPSRISQAQVSIRRDLGLVKEFAGKVAELKDLQGSYLKMIESVQGMIDSDNGQVLLPVRTLRPRSNTSPALSRPPSRSPLASLFQGPDQSLNTTSDSISPSPTTPVTPPTPSLPLYNSTDLAQRMADITARYDSWWECAELLIELGNTPPSMPTPVSTVRLVPPTSIITTPPPPPPTPAATVTSKFRGDAYRALSPAASNIPMSSPSNHPESTLKPSRGRANTFTGNMPVARLRSASTSTASISHDVPNHMLSPSASSASSAPSHTWRATTGRHDLSQRQLVLLRQMLGVDQKQRPSAAASGPVLTVENEDHDELDKSDGESDPEDATWRWGHGDTVQLPSPAEEKEAYFGVAGRKMGHSQPWNRPYHDDVTHSEYEEQGQAVYVTSAPDPSETKKSKGLNAIRDMLRTLKRAHPSTPTSSTFPKSVEAPPSLPSAPKMFDESPQPVANGPNSQAPNKHAIRKAASLLPLSTTAPPARLPSSPLTVSRASNIDPTLAFAMTPDNIKPLLDNAREVRARLGACVADVQELLANAGVDAIPCVAG